MKRPRAILFDLDDTLFDHRHCTCTAVERVHRDRAEFAGCDRAELERRMLGLIDELHPFVLDGRMTLEAARTERWRMLLAWAGSPGADTNAITVLYRAAYTGARRAVPGAPALLKRLKPLARLGVVTNNLRSEQEEKLVECGLDRWIDFMVTSEEAGIAKPDPAMFRVALARAACRADEAVMVGDSWRMDVEGGAAAGIRAVWLNRRGVPCPDPKLATEIASYEPIDDAVEAILGIPDRPEARTAP